MKSVPNLLFFKPMKEEPVWEEAPMLCDDGIWRGRYRYGSGDSWDVAVDEFQPPYRPGEKCYVREAWDCAPDDIADQLFFPVRYKADDCEPFIAWRSPVTMPMWAARRFVTVLSCEPVKIEDVTEEDCLAVGLKKLSKDNGRTWKFGMADRDGLPGTDNTGWAWEDWCVNPIDAFARLWDSINGKTYPWKDNPWVWVIEFKKEKICR